MPHNFHQIVVFGIIVVYGRLMAGISSHGQDNPFATPEERAAQRAGGANSANPFPPTAEISSEMPPPRLIDQEPFDVVVLREDPPHEEEVLPLDLPGRKLPIAPDKNSVLRLRLRSDPATECSVLWGDVLTVRLFEHSVLDEAKQLAAQKRFDEAFDVVTFLRRRYPTLSGVSETEQTILAAEARHEFEQGRAENASALLLRLRQWNSHSPELAELFAAVTLRLVEERLRRGELNGARYAADQLAAEFANHPTTARCRALLNAAVASQIERAKQEITAGRHATGQELLEDALSLAPESSEALKLFEASMARYPRIVVGVVEAYRQKSRRGSRRASADDWATRRIERLLHEPALELAMLGGNRSSPEYVAGWIGWIPDEANPTRGILRITSSDALHPNAHDSAAILLRAASASAPTFRPEWATRKARLSVNSPTELEVQFAKRIPRPEALLADVLNDVDEEIYGAASRLGNRKLVAADGRDMRFVTAANAATTTSGPAEIVERRFSDEDAAMAALLAGEVDIVDRLAPWQIAVLREKRELQLSRYAPLSIHCLCFREGHPLLNMQEFRRALLYAIDREGILRNHLQISDDNQATRVTSGVFSSGRSLDDPLGYGGGSSISPRPYDPQAAFILLRTATAALGARTAKSPKSEPSSSNPSGAEVVSLTLAHPPTATAARACEQIRLQWTRIGIDVRLKPLSEGQTDDDSADVVYRVISAAEPLIDAAQLFGPDGVVRHDRRILTMPLAKLSAAGTFEEARGALYELQRILYEESLLLPLWQINEYMARRSRVTTGPGDRALFSLYQFVDQWRIAPKVNAPIP